MADPTEPEIVVGPDAFGTQRPRRTRTLSTKAQESLEAQEKAPEKSSGTAKRAATNATRTTSRSANDGLQGGKNNADSGAAMLQKVFGVLRILRDEFGKQQEATRIKDTKAQMAEELRQVRGHLDT